MRLQRITEFIGGINGHVCFILYFWGVVSTTTEHHSNFCGEVSVQNFESYLAAFLITSALSFCFLYSVCTQNAS